VKVSTINTLIDFLWFGIFLISSEVSILKGTIVDSESFDESFVTNICDLKEFFSEMTLIEEEQLRKLRLASCSMTPQRFDEFCSSALRLKPFESLKKTTRKTRQKSFIFEAEVVDSD
jgi:hypothetical protein